jgi:hypothetical protein
MLPSDKKKSFVWCKTVLTSLLDPHKALEGRFSRASDMDAISSTCQGSFARCICYVAVAADQRPYQVLPLFHSPSVHGLSGTRCVRTGDKGRAISGS